MSKKLSHEEVFNYYYNEKYILNSIYKGMKYKDKLTCPVGHDIEMRFNSFQNGTRCAKCSGNEKLSHEYVFNYYASENYIMKSIYKNVSSKDKLNCPVGHDIEMRFNTFKQGSRCSICAGNKKYSHEYVEQYYKKYNYTMKSIYKNSLNKDKLICPVGHEIEMLFNNFLHKSYRCRTCYEIYNVGENHPNWNGDQTRQSRSEFLKFNLKQIQILNNDPNYEQYLQLSEQANIERIKGNIHYKTQMTVDHIQPRISFIDNNFDNIYGKELCKKIINKRNNLRIINQTENCSKGGKYNQEEFIKWFQNELIIHLMKI